MGGFVAMSHTVLMIGTFDSKGIEYAFLYEALIGLGVKVLTANVGVLGTSTLFPVDIEAERFATAAGTTIEALRAGGDRGQAMKAMAVGAEKVVGELFAEKAFDGIIGLGGTGGASVVTAAMRVLPLGVPKVCVCTAASGDVSAFVGAKDIAMFPSVVDIAGINRISMVILTRAAGAVVGMVQVPMPVDAAERPIITASMFGNTTACVTACGEALTAKGFEVLVFHAIGSGGRTMESLVREGVVDGVLDITTTEWADELCGGVFSAGPERLSAAGDCGVPQLIVPGCIDMVNFGGPETVPAHFREAGRLFYEWNPSVTLMRTNVEENAALGKIFAEKANAAKGPVAFLIPLMGFSILDGHDERFCDREADGAFLGALEAHLRTDIPIYTLDANINDAAFSERAVELLLELMGR